MIKGVCQLPFKENILIFQPYGGVSEKHFAIALEIIDYYAKQGSKVRVLSCDSKLKPCSYNLSACKQTCISCVSKFKHGMDLLGGYENVETSNFKVKSNFDLRELCPQLFDVINIEELKAISIGDFPIGRGIASILISHFRNPNLILDDNGLKEMVYVLAHRSYEVYVSMIEHLKHPTDMCFFFNGRLPEFLSVEYACKRMGIEYGIFEYGSTIDKYAVYFNHAPHALRKMNRLIYEYWENSDNPEKAKLAERYFQNKISNIVTNDFVYTENQITGQLPSGFDKQKKNIVIFNSSQDEMEACGSEWLMTIYANQNEAVRQIVTEINQRNDFLQYHIYLRVHPNLPIGQEVCSLVEFKNYTVIDRESTVSTYELMRNAWKVISFGSTAGIEASYFGKPSILLAPSLYASFGSTYEPLDHSEVMELMFKELEPLEITGALRYGYFCADFGIQKRITKMSSFLDLESVNNKNIQIDIFAQLRIRFMNLLVRLKGMFRIV